MSNEDLVTLKIDGREVTAPKGANLIEAAGGIGCSIPHYCYHRYLSVAGNCRMCQVEIKGQPKLAIGCNTEVQEGMEVSTHRTSKAVVDAQAAVLEFILINHPLDCTVCDQSGHCRLQDYYYEYSGRLSRFKEEKEHKVKALPLGPHVILDGERCIMCTRCIRFCDEITKTSELGLLKRGDQSVISVNPGRMLDNPLSGNVVDLCPVGALTHRDWRFTSRIWFTKRTDSICPGCSTGCNAEIAARDRQVVHVKARINDAVNKAWLCDEGRYGFGRFLPEKRVAAASVAGSRTALEDAITAAKGAIGGYTGVFLSADLFLEEYELIRRFFTRHHKPPFNITVAYRKRSLGEVEKLLVSPDYAPNYRGAQFAGIISGDPEREYTEALEKLRKGVFRNILVIGDRGILGADVDDSVTAALSKADCSVGMVTDEESPLTGALKVVLPARSILEKSGLLVNSGNRLQYAEASIEVLPGTAPHWKLFDELSRACGGRIAGVNSDRDLTLWYLETERRTAGLKIGDIKAGGVDLAKV